MAGKFIRFTPILLGLLLAVGCEETIERAQFTTATLSYYPAPGLQYDSVFASVSHSTDTLWAGELHLEGSYYLADVNVNPGVTYSVRGGAYIDGLLCFYTNFPISFNLTYGEQRTVSLTMYPQLPAPPDTLFATAATPTSITIQWQHDGQRLTGFEIERGRGSVDSLQAVATVAAQSRSYQNTGLAPNSIYYFRVRAFNPAGYSGYSIVMAAATP